MIKLIVLVILMTETALRRSKLLGMKNIIKT